MNEYLQSLNGKHYLVGQGDGNFVVYEGARPEVGGSPLPSTRHEWASHTNSYPKRRLDPNAVMTLHATGRLEVASHRKMETDTDTNKTDRPFYLKIEDDGTVSLYEGVPEDAGRAKRIWYGSRQHHGKGVAIPYQWKIEVTACNPPQTFFDFKVGTSHQSVANQIAEAERRNPKLCRALRMRLVERLNRA